jgi:hypothetical protein
LGQLSETEMSILTGENTSFDIGLPKIQINHSILHHAMQVDPAIDSRLFKANIVSVFKSYRKDKHPSSSLAPTFPAAGVAVASLLLRSYHMNHVTFLL